MASAGLAPAGQRFLAVAPDFCPVAPEDVAQRATAWTLYGIEQHTLPL